jgi:hypothetical protein
MSTTDTRANHSANNSGAGDSGGAESGGGRLDTVKQSAADAYETARERTSAAW